MSCTESAAVQNFDAADEDDHKIDQELYLLPQRLMNGQQTWNKVFMTSIVHKGTIKEQIGMIYSEVLWKQKKKNTQL